MASSIQRPGDGIRWDSIFCIVREAPGDLEEYRSCSGREIEVDWSGRERGAMYYLHLSRGVDTVEKEIQMMCKQIDKCEAWQE
jgi:hypothetical protein